MIKRKTERARHEFAGQQDGTSLTEWLNGKEPHRIGAERAEMRGGERTRKRIARLIEDLNMSAEEYLRHGVADPKLTKRIDDELARHALRVKTMYVRDEGRFKTFAEPKWMFGWYSSAGERSAEMIFRIVRLGERGLLARVRRCDHCNSWFYAKFNHQRFCSQRCQVLHYQTSEEWKKRRRDRYQDR